MRMRFLVEIIRLGLHLRDQVRAHDRHRHGPVRIEIDLDDPAVDVGRRPVRLADHGGVARHRDAVLDRLDAARPGCCRRTKRGAEIAAHGCAAAPDWCASCASRTSAGTLSALKRLLAHDAVDGQAVARLEAAHRRLDVGIEDVGHAGVGVEIAGQRSGAGAARRTLGLRLPSRSRSTGGTAGQPPRDDDALVARDRLLGVSARSPATASAATPSASGWCARRNRSPGRNRRAGSGRSAPAAARPGRTREARRAPPPAAPRARATRAG